MSIYDNETNIYPDLNPSAPQEPQTYRLKKLTEIEGFFLDEIEVREPIAKKMKRFTHRYRGHRPNYINGDHRRNFYCSICQRCWPASWCCLRWDQLTSFTCNCHHTKIFQNLYRKTRNT